MTTQSVMKKIREQWEKLYSRVLLYIKNRIPAKYIPITWSYSLTKKATRYLRKHSWMQFCGIGIVIAFLLFFLHLFIASAYLTEKVSTDITQKLGFYFYVTESGEDNNGLKQEEIYNRVLHLKDELTRHGLTVEYYSKDDALKLLQQRIPWVIQNFERYGITNPLPATLYVTFDTNDEFTALRGIVSKYVDIVRNSESIQTKWWFGEQQQRVANIINLTHFSTVFSIVLIIVVIIMIIAFLLLIITMKCRQFRKNIEIEKLLGTNYMTIKLPFLITVVIMLIIAFILTYGLVSVIAHYVGSSFAYLFHTSIAHYIYTIGWWKIAVLVLVEFILLSFLATAISDKVLTHMIKQI